MRDFGARLILTCSAEGWFGTAAVPVADIPRLTAEAKASGHEVLHIVRTIVDPLRFYATH
jgi:hypothetical protein